MARMKNGWNHQNLIDLEYLFNLDRDTPLPELHQRDRQIFLALPDYHITPDNDSPSDLLRCWLDHRMVQTSSPTLRTSPGEIYGSSLQLGSQASCLLGILSGLTGGLGFFSYTGTTPINVFHFLLLFVFSQLLLVTLFCTRTVWQRLLQSTAASLSVQLSRRLLAKAIQLLTRTSRNHLDPQHKTAIEYAFGLVKGYSSRYGRLFYWPLATVVQLFGIGFNLGLLTVTMLKIATSDLAFGWQSTIKLSDTGIFTMVKTLALPWRWLFGPGTGYPTLEQVSGSHIVLKDGILGLATSDLTAWWPFLVLCLLCYGFFPRLLLFFIGKFLGAASLQRFNFDTPECLAVVRRMRTPIVSSQALSEPEKTTDNSMPNEENAALADTAMRLFTLIPDDILSLCTREQLDQYLGHQLLKVGEMHTFLQDFDHDQELLTNLGSKQWQNGEGILIIMEGWMPPLLDFLSYLKELRDRVGSTVSIFLALTGRPQGDTFATLSSSHLQLWRQKITGLGDPYLRVFPLSDNEARP
jgi:hypothetical protein